MMATVRNKWFEILVILGLLATPFITWATGTGEEVTTTVEYKGGSRGCPQDKIGISFYQNIMGMQAAVPVHTQELPYGGKASVTDNLDEWFIWVWHKDSELATNLLYKAGKNYIVTWKDNGADGCELFFMP